MMKIFFKKITRRVVAFTLVEVLVAIGAFSLLSGIMFTTYDTLSKTRLELNARQILVEETQKVFESINFYSQNFTVDYEEYFNRYNVGCNNNSREDIGFWNIDTSGHCSDSTYYGNQNSNDIQNTQHRIFVCSSNTVPYTPTPSYPDIKFDNQNMTIGNGCYLKTLKGPQPFGQYKRNFWDVKSDGINTIDDTYLAKGPLAIPDNKNVKELYLISNDERQRVFLRRNCISSEGQELCTIQMLKLRAFDAGVNHDFGYDTLAVDAKKGIFDGVIDTWACDFAQGFACGGAPIDEDDDNSVNYDNFKLALDNNDGWVDLTSDDVHVKSWNLEILPVKDPKHSYQDKANFRPPYVKLSMEVALNFSRHPGLDASLKNSMNLATSTKFGFNKDFYQSDTYDPCSEQLLLCPFDIRSEPLDYTAYSDSNTTFKLLWDKGVYDNISLWEYLNPNPSKIIDLNNNSTGYSMNISGFGSHYYYFDISNEPIWDFCSSDSHFLKKSCGINGSVIISDIINPNGGDDSGDDLLTLTTYLQEEKSCNNGNMNGTGVVYINGGNLSDTGGGHSYVARCEEYNNNCIGDRLPDNSWNAWIELATWQRENITTDNDLNGEWCGKSSIPDNPVTGKCLETLPTKQGCFYTCEFGTDYIEGGCEEVLECPEKLHVQAMCDNQDEDGTSAMVLERSPDTNLNHVSTYTYYLYNNLTKEIKKHGDNVKYTVELIGSGFDTQTVDINILSSSEDNNYIIDNVNYDPASNDELSYRMVLTLRDLNNTAQTVSRQCAISLSDCSDVVFDKYTCNSGGYWEEGPETSDSGNYNLDTDYVEGEVVYSDGAPNNNNCKESCVSYFSPNPVVVNQFTVEGLIYTGYVAVYDDNSTNLKHEEKNIYRSNNIRNQSAINIEDAIADCNLQCNNGTMEGTEVCSLSCNSPLVWDDTSMKCMAPPSPHLCDKFTSSEINLGGGCCNGVLFSDLSESIGGYLTHAVVGISTLSWHYTLGGQGECGFGCASGTHREDNRCVLNSSACTGSLPPSDYTIDYEWTHATLTKPWTYNETSGECYFSCNDEFRWNENTWECDGPSPLESCPTTQPANSTQLDCSTNNPDAERQDATTNFFTDNCIYLINELGQETPAPDCLFECNDGFIYDGSNCVYPSCMDGVNLLTFSQFQSNNPDLLNIVECPNISYNVGQNWSIINGGVCNTFTNPGGTCEFGCESGYIWDDNNGNCVVDPSFVNLCQTPTSPIVKVSGCKNGGSIYGSVVVRNGQYGLQWTCKKLGQPDQTCEYDCRDHNAAYVADVYDDQCVEAQTYTCGDKPWTCTCPPNSADGWYHGAIYVPERLNKIPYSVIGTNTDGSSDQCDISCEFVDWDSEPIPVVNPDCIENGCNSCAMTGFPYCFNVDFSFTCTET